MYTAGALIGIAILFGIKPVAAKPEAGFDHLPAIQFPATPGYVVQRIISWTENDTPDRRVQVMTENGDVMSVARQRSTEAELDRLLDRCFTIAPRGAAASSTGFHHGLVANAIFMTGKGASRRSRVFLDGSTSYDGPGDTQPGHFTCLIEDTNPTFWFFKPDP